MPAPPPTYTHKLYLAFVACASCISAPLLNLASARETYRFNGQQVAVREGVTLTFVYGDHLGSASLTTNISGTKVSEMRYYPFGETRYSSGNTATSKRFTSQEEQVGIGLYDYGARFYDPAIGRFISADSVTSKPGDPQNLNRYSYTNNRPLNLVDPSGHCGTTPEGQPICEPSSSTASVALTVAPMNLKIEAAAKRQWEIRPIPKDVTTMLVTNDPGGALSLIAPYAVAVAPYAASAASAAASTVAIDMATRCLMSNACEKALNLVNGQNNGFYTKIGEDEAQKLAKASTLNAGTGYVALGHYPEYAVTGDFEGLTRLQIPDATWRSLNTYDLWRVNRAFLDQAISRGDRFVITTDVQRYSFFAEEIQYLIDNGYKLVNGMLVKQ
jgi:RHS repeat-associated protein